MCVMGNCMRTYSSRGVQWNFVQVDESPLTMLPKIGSFSTSPSYSCSTVIFETQIKPNRVGICLVGSPLIEERNTSSSGERARSGPTDTWQRFWIRGNMSRVTHTSYLGKTPGALRCWSTSACSRWSV